MKLIMTKEECDDDCYRHGLHSLSSRWQCNQCHEWFMDTIPHIHMDELVDGDLVGYCSEGCAIAAEAS